MVGVAAVGLGAGGTPRGATVVAADEELTGWQLCGFELLKYGADFAGAGVEFVLCAMAGEADGAGTAPEAGELAEDTGQLPVCGESLDFSVRGFGFTRNDGSVLV